MIISFTDTTSLKIRTITNILLSPCNNTADKRSLLHWLTGNTPEDSSAKHTGKGNCSQEFSLSITGEKAYQMSENWY